MAVSPLEAPTDVPYLSLSELTELATTQPAPYPPHLQVSGDDTFYIIFTSGSTGVPKGVKISCNCLNYFLDWAVNLGLPKNEKSKCAVLNQAPFSFDLSVMDLYMCLACGGTLWTLSKKSQSDYQNMFSIMKNSHTKVWVSTPSFADLCLVDKHFYQDLLPNLSVFLFCGETLTNQTALALLEHFPIRG